MLSRKVNKVLINQRISSNKLWHLAWPMILANISVPLLGFVDTSVIGHLGNADYLAGTALGSLVITVLFWLFGFLRMSTTGLAAKAIGSENAELQIKIIWQSVYLALVLSAAILLFNQYIFKGLHTLVAHEGMDQALVSAKQYYDLRIGITPIALINLVLSGYLIAAGATKVVLKAVLICNFVNLIADLILVPGMGLGVAGLAYASVLAELTLFVVYLSAVKQLLPQLFGQFKWAFCKLNTGLLSLNTELFLRSCLLQFCLSYMAIYASQFGPSYVALNAIIMQFFLFISFSMDGIAFGLESLVGQHSAQKQQQRIRLFVRTAIWLASSWAILYCLVYYLFSESIIGLLTNVESIHAIAESYMVWIWLLPLVSYLSFIFDGVFVGLGWSKGMLLTMALAALVFVTVLQLFDGLGYHGLWMAFCLFMLTRGLGQLWFYRRQPLL